LLKLQFRSNSFWVEKVKELNRLAEPQLRAKAGARGGSRTHNLQLRRLTLYPIELHARDPQNTRGRAFAQMEFMPAAENKKQGRPKPSLRA
jgi:hypothetical protein